MIKEETIRKHIKGEWCALVILDIAIIILTIMTAINVCPQYPSAKSEEGCILEMERYMQDPLGKVSKGFEIINGPDTIKVKNVNTNVEYICTIKEGGEMTYSSYVPSGVAYILSMVFYILFFIGVYTICGVFIFAIVNVIIESYKENKQIKKNAVQQEKESN